MLKIEDCLVVIGDGHGVDTAGKETPLINGTRIKENTFNNLCKIEVMHELILRGFRVADVSPELTDTPLTLRTGRQIAACKLWETEKRNENYIYISIHYNAYNGVFDNKAGGISVFNYYNSVLGKKLATSLLNQIVKGTKQANRGVKEAGFYVLKNSRGPAALIEFGFMDKLSEALLMTNKAFIKECAMDTVRGIYDYFGITFTEDSASSDLKDKIDKLEYSVRQAVITLEKALTN